MKKLQSFVTLSLALGLVGCTTRSLPLTTAPVGLAGENAPLGASPAVPPSDEYGTLKLDIRWPERPEYRTQVIPTSTNALIVTLRGPSTTTNNLGPATPGPILVQKTITRQPGATSASETFKLKAANNLSLEVLAYQESAPDYATSKPIARGTGNVNIVRSLDNQAFVTLQSLFTPTITTLSTNFGQPNDSLTIAGDNFGEDGTPLPDVVFGGATASVLTRTSSRSLTVTVPSDAKTGRLSVVVDGVTSNYFGGFWIPGSLAISAPKQPWDTGTSASSRAVLFGQTLQFTATPTWTNLAGVFGAAPQPTWSCSNPTAGSFAATAGNFGNSGLFTAGTSYATGAITAKYDNGQSSTTSNTLSAVAEGVVVSVETPSATLGAKGQDSLKLKAFNTLSDGATNSLVTFAASEGVSVDATGLATGSTGVNGNVQVAVTSQLLAGRTATTSIKVANYVVSTLAGHLTRGSTDGDALTYAELAGPLGIAVDKTTGTTFVSQISLPLRRIANGQVTTLALSDMAFYPNPQGLDYDAASKTLYLADNAFQRIYKIALTGDTTAVATWSIFAGEETAGAYSSGNTGRYLNGTGTAARFNNPTAVAWDSVNQCLYVADRDNKVIRKITAAGDVSLYAGTPLTGTTDVADGPVNEGTFSFPNALTLDPDGNLYVLDYGKIRKVDPSGTITTLPTSKPVYGSSVYQAKGYSVAGLVRDAAGNLFVCEDYYTNVVDRIAPDGTVTRIAGTGGQTYNPYGGPYQASKNGTGTLATFSGPTCLAIDATGSLYVTDFWNNEVRLLK